MECYEKNIKQFNDPYDYEQIAILLYEQKRYKESVEAYTKKAKLEKGECSPASSGVYINLVSNLERAGDHLFYVAHNMADNY